MEKKEKYQLPAAFLTDYITFSELRIPPIDELYVDQKRQSLITTKYYSVGSGFLFQEHGNSLITVLLRLEQVSQFGGWFIFD